PYFQPLEGQVFPQIPPDGQDGRGCDQDHSGRRKAQALTKSLSRMLLEAPFLNLRALNRLKNNVLRPSTAFFQAPLPLTPFKMGPGLVEKSPMPTQKEK